MSGVAQTPLTPPLPWPLAGCRGSAEASSHAGTSGARRLGLEPPKASGPWSDFRCFFFFSFFPVPGKSSSGCIRSPGCVPDSKPPGAASKGAGALSGAGSSKLRGSAAGGGGASARFRLAEREPPSRANSAGDSWRPARKLISSCGRPTAGDGGGWPPRASLIKCIAATNSANPRRPLRLLSASSKTCLRASVPSPDRRRTVLASSAVSTPSRSASIRWNSRAYLRQSRRDGASLADVPRGVAERLRAALAEREDPSSASCWGEP
mmetsp:Transcript_53376/g.159319  ORF Transcript_53376/g.159319 Transcript_53376/m.159319 type:complete len:265 (+) Transcript_53376:783-1577(+)